MKRKPISKINPYKHRDCEYAERHFSPNYKGDNTLCYCRYEEYAMLLSDPACPKIKLKQ